MIPDYFSYKITKDTLVTNTLNDYNIVFSGHTHIPSSYMEHDWNNWLEDTLENYSNDVIIQSFVDYSYPYPLAEAKTYYFLSFRDIAYLTIFKLRFSEKYDIIHCTHSINRKFKTIHNFHYDVSNFTTLELEESKKFMAQLDNSIAIMKTIPHFSLDIFEIIHTNTNHSVVDMMSYRYGSQYKGIHFFDENDITTVSAKLREKNIGFSFKKTIDNL